MRKKTGLILRLLFGIGMLGFVLLQVDFAYLREALLRVSPGLYLSCVALMGVYLVLQSAILSRALRLCGYAVPVGAMVRQLAISNFFGVFLPGGAGPDLVLFIRLSQGARDKSNPFSAILFVRMVGMVAVLLLAFLVGGAGKSPLPGVTGILGLVLVGLALAYGVFTSRRCGRLAGWIFQFLKRHPWTHLVYRAVATIAEVGRNRRLVLVVLSGSLLVGVLRATMDGLFCAALGYPLPWFYFPVFSALVTLATLLPVTVAGIGVREGTYVALLGTAGVPAAAAFAVSLLSFSLILWVCLLGAVFYLVRKPEAAGPEPAAGDAP